MARDVRGDRDDAKRSGFRQRSNRPPGHAIPGGDAASDSHRKLPSVGRRSFAAGGARAPVWDEVNIARAADEWLDTYVATARNPKGQDLAFIRVESYLRPALGHFRLRDLTGDDIRRYRLALEQQAQLRPYTVTHVLSDLRCFLRWAVTQGLIERSPFPPRVMPKIPEVAPRGFDDLDLELLMAVGGRLGFVLKFLLGTGLRWAEACRSTKDDVRGGMLKVESTKSGRVRRVPLSPALLEAIAGCEHRLVPYSVKSPGTFSRRVREWTEIEDFHVHRCRHTFAMRWLDAGGNLAVLQQILGHRDLSTTMRYARVTDELIQREAERVVRASDRLRTIRRNEPGDDG